MFKFIERKVTLGNILTTGMVLTSFIVGYTKMGDKLDQVSAELKDHKDQQMHQLQGYESTYQRRDVQDVRNKFIDLRLESIETKIDLMRDEMKPKLRH